MTRRIVLLTVLATLLGASVLEAAVVGKGKRGRNLLRAACYATQLQNDKLAVYEEHGFPVHRIRENFAGRITETWTYYELGLAFTFDEDSRIVETRTFRPEDRRENIIAFPGAPVRPCRRHSHS